jgi:hypothetical protein
MNFEAAMDIAQMFASEVWRILSSPLAVRIYVCTAGIAVLVGSGFKAHETFEALKDTPPDFRMRGARPRRERSLRRRLADYEAAANNAVRAALLMAGKVVLLGYLVPTILLMAGLYWYGWLTFGGSALVEGTRVVDSPDPVQVLMFSVTQLARGSLADVMDVFGLSWGPLTADPTNYLLLALLVGYRIFVGLWSLVLIVSMQRLIRLKGNAKDRIKEVRDALGRLAAS